MPPPRLHPDTIEEVKQRADIYDVVSEHVVLRKQGKNFLGLCPFHDEKTPSFHVNPSKQMYYCFGCGKGGNAITFLKELGKQSFSEIVLDLARRYQVPVKTLEPEQRQEFQRQLSLREQLYEICAIAASFYQHALRQTEGKKALDYLKNDRQLNEATIQKFQLGYAPPGWETLYGYLVRQKHFPVELVEKAGLIIPRSSGGTHYDRFRDRVIVPIHDSQGRAIGFGGRTLTDEQPKYLNSPETELFEKGKTLFALDKAKLAISKSDRAVVVEGYFDAIALHAAGIENVVASLGTALSSGQVKQLLRYTQSKQIILNFDADAAGIKASQRAIGEIENLAYQGEVQLRILNLPDGKDADEFLRNSSSENYQNLLDNAPLWLDWQIDRILADRDLERADLYHDAVEKLVKLLVNLTHSTTKSYYINRCAERLSRGDSRLVPLLAENLVARVRRSQLSLKNDRSNSSNLPPLPFASERSLLEQSEALLLRIYLHCPEHRSVVTEAITELEEKDIYFSFSHHRYLWQQLIELQETAIESSDLMSQLHDRLSEGSQPIDRLSHILYADEKQELDVRRSPLVIRAAMACIERVMCQKRYRHVLALWSETDPEENPELSRLYQAQIYEEKARMAELDERRYTDFDDLIQFPDRPSLFEELT
ncbi:MAG TPA: DNA primase [Oscillatoriales cyanobacterium M59_W2019_021]|nr:DNA primase [Oscillatoriales cyanobacterium M4454_W2019_049]HIK50680.1 DNA primase [Oscillatoriales cyanobacterium M59_W2019_021]